MTTVSMPAFTAEASLYGADAANRYIMRSAMISGSIDDVLPQMPFDRCLSLYRRIYIGCRLDGGDIGWCSYYSDFYWDAMGC